MRILEYDKLFRSLRKKRNLTQVELAKMLDTIQSRISKIEKGQVDPSANEILHFVFILEAFSYSPLDELMRECPPEDWKIST